MGEDVQAKRLDLSPYEHPEWCGDPRIVVVPLDMVDDAYAIVFADPVIGGTSIAVYRPVLP